MAPGADRGGAGAVAGAPALRTPSPPGSARHPASLASAPLAKPSRVDVPTVKPGIGESAASG
jgi:hypothetical protein